MVIYNLRIDFLAGPVPGQMTAVLRLVSPGGEVLASEVGQPVGVGKSLAFGPVQVLTGLPIQVVVTPPETKGLTAGQAAAQLAATGS